MGSWWQTQNTDEVYLICETDWSSIADPMPYSADIDPFYWDFGNGYVPFFAVIGNYYMYMYGDNPVQGAIDMVPDAIASFTQMGVINPIPNQSIGLNETLTYDITDMFAHPQGEPISMVLAGNTNPDVVTASLDANNILTIQSADQAGESTLTIGAQGGTLQTTYDFTITVVDVSNHFVYIADFDPTSSAQQLKTAIEGIYTNGPVYIANDFTSYPLDNCDAMFIQLGVYSNNYSLTEAEVAPVVTYLNNGGNAYMEGGDTWAYDTQTSLHDLFSIDGTDDGSSDMQSIEGMDFLAGNSWTYSGENNWMDHLAPLGDAVTVFHNSNANYDCGVAYDSGTYRTVGTSFEITGLGGTNTLDDALLGILEFFDILAAPLDPPTNLAVDDVTGLVTWDAPVTDDLTGYNVYLDGVMQEMVTDTQYQLTGLINGLEYVVTVTAVYDDGESEGVLVTFTYNGTNAGTPLVNATALMGNYPNPFNPETQITYELKEEQSVSLEVFNARGQKVTQLVNEVQTAGRHQVMWNGTDENNTPVSSGMYFYKMQAGTYTSTKKMILMK